MKTLTAIIPTLLKNKEYLVNLIDVLSSDNSVEKIIIVNNSKEQFKTNNSKTKIIFNGENLYVNPSWNLGVKLATTEYVALINDDIKIPNNFCSKILEKVNDNMGIIGMNSDNVINTRNKAGEIVVNSEKVPLGNSQDIELIPIFQRPDCYGVFMLFKKSNYVEIPEDVKIYFGDDWIIREAAKQGKTNVTIYGQNIYHLGSLSSGSFNNWYRKEITTYKKQCNKQLTFIQKLHEKYYKYKNKKVIKLFGCKLYINQENSINYLLTKDTKKFPIYIISFNRLTYLKQLIEKLEYFGYTNIHVIDNCSTYPPLLEYLKTLGHKVHYLNKNYGHDVFWKCEIFDETIKNSYYAVTDCDIMPIENCPDDFLELFFKILIKNLKFTKVGFSLKIADIPNYNNQKDFIINWESKFYNFKYHCKYKDKFINIYDADIDTTFALYRPSFKNFYKAIRTGAPYQAYHLPWYKDSTAPLSNEDKFYIENVDSEISNYSVSDKKTKTLRQKIISRKIYSQYYEVTLLWHTFIIKKNKINTNLS